MVPPEHALTEGCHRNLTCLVTLRFSIPDTLQWTVHCIKWFSRTKIATVNGSHKIHVCLYFHITFDDRSTALSPSWWYYLTISNWHWTISPENSKQCLCTAQIYFSDCNSGGSAWDTILNSEWVKDENDRMGPKMEQTEASTVAE